MLGAMWWLVGVQVMTTAAIACIVTHAFIEHREFHPALTSAGSSNYFSPLALLWTVQTGLLLWLALLRLCYGRLRLIERARLVEHGLCFSAEVLVSMTMIVVVNSKIRIDAPTVALFLGVVSWRLMHLIADWRVHAAESGLELPRHRWLVPLLLCFGVIDAAVVHNCSQKLGAVGFAVLLLHEFLSMGIVVAVQLARMLLKRVNHLHEGRWEHQDAALAVVTLVGAAARLTMHNYFVVALYMNSYVCVVGTAVRPMFSAARDALRSVRSLRALRALSSRIDNWIPNATAAQIAEAGDATCPICFEELTVGKTKRLCPCGHMFHRSCIRLWLHRSAKCPYCRQRIKHPRAPSRERHQQPSAGAAQPTGAERRQGGPTPRPSPPGGPQGSAPNPVTPPPPPPPQLGSPGIRALLMPMLLLELRRRRGDTIAGDTEAGTGSEAATSPLTSPPAAPCHGCGTLSDRFRAKMTPEAAGALADFNAAAALATDRLHCRLAALRPSPAPSAAGAALQPGLMGSPLLGVDCEAPSRSVSMRSSYTAATSMFHAGGPSARATPAGTPADPALQPAAKPPAAPESRGES